jgi:hypothetical protein
MTILYPVQKVEKEVDGAGAWSDPILIPKGETFDVSISGVWTGTIKLRRSHDRGDTWQEIESFTANTEQIGESGAVE